IAVAPFQGVPYEAPSDDVIVSEQDIRSWLERLGKGGNRTVALQVVNILTRRKLLPLRYSSSALPYLCKLLGFVMGDGNIHFQNKTGKGAVSFLARSADLEAIRTDLAAVGVRASRVYQRQKQCAIHNGYAQYTFEHQEEWVKVGSTSLAVLLACL